jgi:hypothetical protein
VHLVLYKSGLTICDMNMNYLKNKLFIKYKFLSICKHLHNNGSMIKKFSKSKNKVKRCLCTVSTSRTSIGKSDN